MIDMRLAFVGAQAATELSASSSHKWTQIVERVLTARDMRAMRIEPSIVWGAVRRAVRSLTRCYQNISARHLSRIWLPGALFLSAVATLSIVSPANAQYEPPKQTTLGPTGVDLSSPRHKFTYKVVDLSIGPFTLERTYMGGGAISGSNYFGPNWTHNYSAFVAEGDVGRGNTDKTYVVIGNSTVHFTKAYYSSTDQYMNTNPDSFGTTLEIVGGAFVYKDKQGNVYTFNAAVKAFTPPINGLRNQRVARIDYADGHTLNYTYNSAGKLTQIASNRGYSLVFEYGTQGFVTKACGYNRAITYTSATTTCAGAALVTSYTYPPGTPQSPNVIGVTDVMGQAWGYDYQYANMSCVRQVNSSNCLITNSYPEGGIQQTMADGAVWNYTYDIPVKVPYDDPYAHQPGQPPLYSSGSYTGPEGLTGVAVFGAGLLNYYSESFTTNPLDPWAEVSRTILTGWDGVELASITHPEGNRIGYSRDGRGNVVSETWTPKPGSGLPPVSSSSAFPDSALLAADCTSVVRKICNKPISKKDYNGNQTDFTYDPAHGGVLTETAPADASGVRAVKRTAYVQRYAWIKNSGGTYSQAAPAIWLISTEKMCRTSATVSGSCAAGASDEVTTSYDYGPDSGPNTLLLRGKVVTADGVSLRSCYGYDAQGNQISETSPRAGLTVCP
ncbi:RHS repeat protein [Sphingomonas sp. ERG5]|uniref:RHS repeat protein n=1 Tax=Sphingomonas sp. ERG5 TaxID=1381597 RepID=UPI000AA07FC2|nr:RHS repeat protein [Sphingomonas sp. ERG5]